MSLCRLCVFFICMCGRRRRTFPPLTAARSSSSSISIDAGCCEVLLYELQLSSGLTASHFSARKVLHPLRENDRPCHYQLNEGLTFSLERFLLTDMTVLSWERWLCVFDLSDTPAGHFRMQPRPAYAEM